MKIAVCDKCKKVFPLKLIRLSCDCGRIQGSYWSNGLGATVWLQSLKGCRILGLDTHFIYGDTVSQTSEAWIFDWFKSGLRIYLKDSKSPDGFKEIKPLEKGYAANNAYLFLKSSVNCIDRNMKWFKNKKKWSSIKNELQVVLKKIPRR